MKWLKWGLLIIVALVVLLFGYLWYLGMFIEPKPYEAKTGPFVYAYEEYVGEYKNTGATFDKVYKIVQAEKIGATRGIGIYFDDPAKVAANKLRSWCGTIIEEQDWPKLKTLVNKVKLGSRPQQDSIIAEFPLRNMLSYAMGPMKCYPAIVKYAAAKGYKASQAIEIYDMPNKKILFIMEIQK